MGFYGNITNTAKTQFQFDRVYSNRNEMEVNASMDGIYAGRYVLVEYDNDLYPIVYEKDGGVYTSPNYEEITRIRISIDGTYSSTAAPLGSYVRIYDKTKVQDIYEARNDVYEIYKLNGQLGEFAVLVQLSEEEKKTDPHYLNYNIDKKYAEKLGEQIGRGWDSTVWQKVYIHGVEKYVMIAELNSVVPTFAVSADAPSMYPIAPHFDLKSTNMYYLMHQQPQWGFRVKAARGDLKNPILDENGVATNNTIDCSTDKVNYPSDEKVVWSRAAYDVSQDKEEIHYYDGENWTTEQPAGGLDAAIYYNKAGFDSRVESTVNLEDKISIMPTGQSGHEYNAHDGKGGLETKEDIQELSMILPSIGNSVSEMWNLIYGKGIGEAGERNLDVSWNSTAGRRMLHPVQGGDGYSYSPDEVSTLAGAINSVHDLMGMIIKTDYDPALNNTLPDDMDKIYYYNNKFYRKGRDYEYQPAEYTYNKVELTEDTFTKNYYYYKNGEDYIADLNNSFDGSKEYYVRTLNRTSAKPLITGEELFAYNTSDFYTLDNKNYLLSTTEGFNKYNTYYRVKSSETKTFDRNYEANKYYARTENSPVRYELLTGTFDGSRNLYTLQMRLVNDGSLPFKAGRYYIQTINDEVTTFSPAMSYDSAQDYFRRKTAPTAEGKYEYEEVTLFNLGNGEYYAQTENGYIQTYDADLTQYYKAIEIIEYAGNSLYIPNTYYYLDNGNYMLSISDTAISSDTIYYTLSFAQIQYFYEANKYLYKEGNSYLIDTNTIMTSDRNYYLPVEYFILSDSIGFANKYSKWNNNVENVPCTIELGTRKDAYRMIELKGFANSLNTIHGLILEMNHMFETQEYEHRDNETARGLINQLKDIIFQFGELNPKDVVIVDDYGRMHGASISGDNWISIEIDSNVSSADIEIAHKAPVTVTTENENYDFNAEGSNFSINQNTYDVMGHITGSYNVDVTLPNSFKDLTLSADTGNFSKTAQTPRDSYSVGIKGDNSIISTLFNDSNMVVKHKDDYSTISEITANNSSLVPGDMVLTDYVVTRDNFGHTINVTGNKYKLPEYTVSSTYPDTNNNGVYLLSNVKINENTKTQIDANYYNIEPILTNINTLTTNLGTVSAQAETNKTNISNLNAALEKVTNYVVDVTGSNFENDIVITESNVNHQIALNKVLTKSKGAGDYFKFNNGLLEIKKDGLYELSCKACLTIPAGVQAVDCFAQLDGETPSRINNSIILMHSNTTNGIYVSTGTKIVNLNVGQKIGLIISLIQVDLEDGEEKTWKIQDETYLNIKYVGEQDENPNSLG